MSGVTAVVAAYNEADRIGRVLEVLASYPRFDEVVVVDDGSSDDTVAQVARYPVTCLQVTPNQGKGHAMDVGVRHADSDVIFFADADIVGLTHAMIDAATAPVLDGSCEMFVMMRNRKVFLLRTLLSFIPLLGGERAVTRQLWLQVPDRYKHGFRIEAGLNFYAVHHGAGLRYRVFAGVSQTIKEVKFGVRNGVRQRIRMSADVVAAAWDLQRNDLPSTTASYRRAALQIALAATGMLIGLLVVAGAIAGPVTFFQTLFAAELREDPSAPLIGVVLRLVSGLGGGALLAVGATVFVLNVSFFVAGLVRVVTASRNRAAG